MKNDVFIFYSRFYEEVGADKILNEFVHLRGNFVLDPFEIVNCSLHQKISNDILLFKRLHLSNNCFGCDNLQFRQNIKDGEDFRHNGEKKSRQRFFGVWKLIFFEKKLIMHKFDFHLQFLINFIDYSTFAAHFMPRG